MNKFQMKFTRRVRSSVRQNIARGVLMMRSRQEEEEEEEEALSLVLVSARIRSDPTVTSVLNFMIFFDQKE